uniref:NADH-ubiquinone oxidoreductase chain 6 n=1 Tax=Lamprigera yunnana TaxID=370605 RepID=A0A5C0PXD0_9COLE|nr:NADH dehydrogenase subunit 6 [Lamprigera yunnana]QEJ81510.1 NADH dehydrogenase subunit 6 [Lamprigera yunnana]
MLFIMMMLSLTSIMFLLTNHPLSMGLSLLCHTLLISMNSSLLSSNFWYSYILFLIMIGGLMILFIYMTSIASNEKFKLKNITIIMMFLIMMFSIIVFMMLNDLLNYNSFINMDMLNYTQPKNFKLSMNKYLTFPMMSIFTIIIMYLFMTMIMSTKITNMKMGPLRKY